MPRRLLLLLIHTKPPLLKTQADTRALSHIWINAHTIKPHDILPYPLNPSISAYTLETNTLGKHNILNIKTLLTNMQMPTYTHIHAMLISVPDWLSVAKAGRGELRSHGVCCCNPLLHPRTGWPPPPAAAAAVTPDGKRK